MSLDEVARFLHGKQCREGMRTGECNHPACQRARAAKETVEMVAEVVEPSKPKLAEAG